VARDAFGPVTPWRWLQQAVGLLRAQPRAMIGATSLLLAVALAPSVVQLALAGASPQLAQVLAVLLSLLLYPPAVAGYYRVVHTLAQDGQAPPTAIFAVFSDGAAVRRMVIANLIFLSGSLLLLSLLFWLFGGEELMQFMQTVSTLQPGAKTVPALPAGALPLLVSVALLAAAVLSAQGLAYAELALGTRPPLAAIAASFGLVARHFGLLLLFYIPVAVFAFLAFMLVALVAVLIGTLLSALSPALASVLVLVMSLALVLALYALLFTFFYFAWRELFGGASATTPPPTSPTHEIAA
jgi:hypothetical protein